MIVVPCRHRSDDDLRLSIGIPALFSERLLISCNKVAMPENKMSLNKHVIKGASLNGEENTHNPVNVWSLVAMDGLMIVKPIERIRKSRYG